MLIRPAKPNLKQIPVVILEGWRFGWFGNLEFQACSAQGRAEVRWKSLP